MKKAMILLIFCMLLPLAGCGQALKPQESYTAYIGEMFYLPNVNGVEYEVIDNDGSKVELFNNSFMPAKMNDYSLTIRYLGKTYNSSIKIIDRIAPEIKIENKFRYVMKGYVSLPNIDVFDMYTEETILPVINVTKNGESVEISDNKFYADSGTYTITVSAKDSSGNISIAKAYVEVTNNASKLKSIAAFESEYGVNHFDRRYGLTPNYISLENLPDEIILQLADLGVVSEGLTELYFGSDITPNRGRIFLNNLLIKDVSDYSGLYFYVYNDSSYEPNLALNYGDNFKLNANSWTKIDITNINDLKDKSGSTAYKQGFSIEDINGILISITLTTGDVVMDHHSFYLTNIYAY